MEAHGCQISKVQPEQVPRILDNTNFCFLFAQIYHPAMKHVAALRKEIGLPTVFNLLGPMSNPARPSRVVVGVHSPQIGGLMANALKLTGIQEILVVCGAEKLDEVRVGRQRLIGHLAKLHTQLYFRSVQRAKLT